MSGESKAPVVVLIDALTEVLTPALKEGARAAAIQTVIELGTLARRGDTGFSGRHCTALGHLGDRASERARAEPAATNETSTAP